MNPCKCGCGTLVKWNYRQGHGRRGRKNSPEHNRQIAKANKSRKHDKPAWNKGIYGVYKHSEETKRKIAEASKGRRHPNRKPASEVTRRKISELQKGHLVSNETRAKISAANSGTKNGMYGKTHTKEARETISKRAKELWNDKDSKIRKYVGSEKQRQHARAARRKLIMPLQDSSIETAVKAWLNLLNIRYIQHRQMDEIEHSYQCDFFISSKNAVIECDGIYWHNYPDGREIDRIRTKELEETGFTVLRLWEHDIKNYGIRCLLPLYYQKLKRMNL